MKISSPSHVRAARITRLAREASTPVYSTSTPAPVREHVTMVEFEDDYHRSWSGPFYSTQQQRDEIARMEEVGYWISDLDCSAKCWCVREK